MDSGGRSRCFFLPPGRLLVGDLVVKVVRADPWLRVLLRNVRRPKNLVVVRSYTPNGAGQFDCNGFLGAEDLQFRVRPLDRNRFTKRCTVRLDYRGGKYAVLCKLEKRLGLWWTDFSDISLGNRNHSVYHDAPWDAP